MNRRKEICRNFQRGSCQYGDRCKFLHVSQQQSKPNPSGFGTQGTVHFPNTTSQQKHNPFGFGMKNDTQSQSNLKGSPNFGARDQIPTKPFQNKWTRSSAGSTGVTSSQPPEAQSHSSDHQCTDPELCKKVILDDFKSEALIWKLTCYGHRKHGPCDIVGDISYEELRAAAYQDVRSGMNVQSIVERERNLCFSKLNEFDNLLKNPYVSQNPRFPQPSPPPVSIINAPSSKFQCNGTPSFSSFSQLNSAANLGPNSTNPPGIQNRPSFSSFSQLNSAANLGSNSTNPPGIQNSTVFGQSNPMQGAGQNSAGFGGCLGKYKVGMEHSKVIFKHGDSKRQMPKDPSQISDEHKMLKKSIFVKANDSEDARKGEVREERQDRISQLPHDMLVTILTFLPFREAVRTSVLSRRWRHNWTFNPNLNLLVADTLGQRISTIRPLDIHSQVYQELGKKYMKIVDQVLSAYSKLKVDLFRVELFFVEDFATHLSEWLENVFEFGVEKLEITVPDNTSLPEKPLIVPCPSRNRIHLKHLLLRSCIFTNFDSLDCFKFLKSLNLDCTVLRDKKWDKKLERFLSNCESLEWMRLTMCPGPKLSINYPSTKLKYLSIFPSDDVDEVEVYSKSLVTFELHGFFIHSVVVDAPSLVDAWFHVLDGHNSSLQKFIRLLSDTSQLQKLILNFLPLSENHKLVSILPQVLSTITNLKVLVLNMRIFSNIDLRWVFSVMKDCPFLQELQLHLFHMNKGRSYRQIEVSDPTLSHLEVAEISGFFGHQSQIDLVSHLLKHANVLKSLIIHEATKTYLGEGNFSWETDSCFNLNRSKPNSAHQSLLNLVPPNLLVYNYYDGSP